VSEGAVVDYVKQTEAGVKYRSGPFQAYLTGFYSKTEETNFDFGLGFFSNKYRSYGLEAEGTARFGLFSISASGTYTDAEITSSSLSPANVGNRPRRQAKFVYQVSPQVSNDRFAVGANVVGTTDSFAQDSNQLKLPGFTQVNAFASFKATDQIELLVNANNLFNVTGFTEAEEGSIPANGYVRARSINGRSISGSVRFTF
jgi:outer membrane receptor protein involved in Fe transport